MAGLTRDQRIAPVDPAARQQHPKSPVCVGQPWPLHRAFEDAELMAQRQDLHGELAARSEEGQRRVEEGTDDVQHGSGPWLGPGQISMISRWTGYSGGTSPQTSQPLFLVLPARCHRTGICRRGSLHCWSSPSNASAALALRSLPRWKQKLGSWLRAPLHGDRDCGKPGPETRLARHWGRPDAQGQRECLQSSLCSLNFRAQAAVLLTT